jgi:hypothetical protein
MHCGCCHGGVARTIEGSNDTITNFAEHAIRKLDLSCGRTAYSVLHHRKEHKIQWTLQSMGRVAKQYAPPCTYFVSPLVRLCSDWRCKLHKQEAAYSVCSGVPSCQEDKMEDTRDPLAKKN